MGFKAKASQYKNVNIKYSFKIWDSKSNNGKYNTILKHLKKH